MLQFLWPTIIAQLAAAVGRKAAVKKNSREESIVAFFRAQRQVAIVAILGAILYGLYSTYAATNLLERGAGAYSVLGLGPGATLKQISQAYRRLSLIYHPDKNPAGAEQYKLVNLTQDILKSPTLKFLYDNFGLKGLEAYEMMGDTEFATTCQEKYMQSIMFWASSLFMTSLGFIVGSHTLSYQLLVVGSCAGLELGLTTRQWYSWYLPLPIFQCVKVIRTALPIVMASVPLLVPNIGTRLQVETAELYRSLSKAEVLASRHLEAITAPFESDELTMKRLQSVANGALE